MHFRWSTRFRCLSESGLGKAGSAQHVIRKAEKRDIIPLNWLLPSLGLGHKQTICEDIKFRTMHNTHF